jgi:hypothetical protein
MKPRLRLVVDNSRSPPLVSPPPPPRWSDEDFEYMVNRAKYLVRNVRMSDREKDRVIRAYLAEADD